MKIKLNDLKKELLARVAKEIRTFDFASKLSPERRARLERQFSKLRTALTEVAEIVRQARKAPATKPAQTSKKSAQRSNTTARKAPASSAKRTASKSSSSSPKSKSHSTLKAASKKARSK